MHKASAIDYSSIAQNGIVHFEMDSPRVRDILPLFFDAIPPGGENWMNVLLTCKFWSSIAIPVFKRNLLVLFQNKYKRAKTFTSYCWRCNETTHGTYECIKPMKYQSLDDYNLREALTGLQIEITKAAKLAATRVYDCLPSADEATMKAALRACWIN